MAIPVLHCARLDVALDFYIGVLAAELLARSPSQGDLGYAVVRVAAHEMHLSSNDGDGVSGCAVVLQVPDVDAVFREFLARGHRAPLDRGPVFREPTDQTWGLREFYVADPDGNTLRFATPLA